jgi:predicted transcriptional regulator
MKKTITISISLPIAVDNNLQRIATETNVSKSAVATAILSLALKWYKVEEVLKNGLSRR